MVKRRRKEADTTWWHDLQIHLPAATQRYGRLTDEPAPVDFQAPASRCDPVQGQAYDQVPTERHGVTPDWKIEQAVSFGTESGSARIVHRSTYRVLAQPATTGQARTALERPDTATCQLCRPDRPLGRAA
ncbi:DUF6233 domain-containing protein [Streptomyces sp. HPF1205]|uniref:DUF6233 domain-containing protein n=1 Tax=Streptomyces sp. HPF1205 TaxID=2873262 RepID=UPI001CEC0434|nr:DUF6233 domain-containing protein [Streptomyces sp. HPF1205]